MHAPANGLVDLACDLASVREAQARWSETPIRNRLRFVRNLRHAMAENAEALAAIGNRPIAEKLMSEVLPLIEACRWLTRQAQHVLATQKFGGRLRPLWLHGASFEVRRKALGIVLVIGPGNYPLFLPAVQSLHALVAGNAVLLKPAPGTRAIALRFADLARTAGLDSPLLTILPEETDASYDAIDRGVDKVIFTGSSANGRKVLAALAQTNTPAITELSGEDAVIVLADADVDLVVNALRFGFRLNDGATCIASRRLVLEESIASRLLSRLSTEERARLEIHRAGDRESVVRLANANAHGLGASIFSRDIPAARAIATRLRTGFVTINDLIVPTADPRMPFGGIKASGFGTTRGAEGLLEMTHPHVIALRCGRRRPHFEKARAADAKLFTAFIKATHGHRGQRAMSLWHLLGAIWARRKDRHLHS